MKALRIIVILLLILQYSCTKEIIDPINYGKVSGTVLEALSQQGMDSLKIWLLDVGTEVDTIQYDNQSLFLDSTFSDNSGYFEFDSLVNGKYAIYPDNISYNFIAIEGSDSLKFELKEGEEYNIAMEAMPNLMGSFFYINLEFYNVPTDLEENKIRLSSQRLSWWWFVIPVWNDPINEMRTVNPDGTVSYELYYCWGNYYGIYIFENRFGYHVTHLGSDPINVFNFHFQIYTPISNTPEHRTYTIDYETMIPVLKE